MECLDENTAAVMTAKSAVGEMIDQIEHPRSI